MGSPFSLALLIILFSINISDAQNLQFIFNGFNENQTNLVRDSVSIIKPSGALRLTNRTEDAIGHAFYSNPIQIFSGTSSTSSKPQNLSSFSTTFVFAIVPPSSGEGGYGLAFTLSPSTHLSGVEPGHYLGLFNRTNDGNSTNHILAVEFDTVNGFNDDFDSEGNHVGVNINSMYSNASKPAAYSNNTRRSEELKLESGKPIQAWIEYDGLTKVLNVTLCPMGQGRPTIPLISFPDLDLTSILKDVMYVGFSASTGKKTSSHYVLGWSFSLNSGPPPPLDLSKLPMPPTEKDSRPFKTPVIAIIGSLCILAVILLGILILITWYRKRMQTETLEDWELDCPHRFSYRDLHVGTKGFKESEKIGSGGFGTVYRGVLPTTRNIVAVKKITSNNPIQGSREFTAEIESLGRLRHKNLVNLQGWCKHKNDMFLVYDFIPNGNLYSLLHSPGKGVPLSWEQRLNIIKGISAGLLYLHEEWEQVVIHRDVKSSNVLIDAELNGRLGDFGLARLYDHGSMAHTTNVVGTIGYIAPELARTGRASTSSDVFAYGVLILEIASGKRPITTDDFILVDWVVECQEMGRILDVVDPKLGSKYVVQEMEMILKLGLLCSHQKQEARPSIRQVIRLLNGDDKMQTIGNLDYCRSEKETNAQLLQAISADSMSVSYSYQSSSTGFRSTSIGGISTSSMDAGR